MSIRPPRPIWQASPRLPLRHRVLAGASTAECGAWAPADSWTRTHYRRRPRCGACETGASLAPGPHPVRRQTRGDFLTSLELGTHPLLGTHAYRRQEKG